MARSINPFNFKLPAIQPGKLLKCVLPAGGKTSAAKQGGSKFNKVSRGSSSPILKESYRLSSRQKLPSFSFKKLSQFRIHALRNKSSTTLSYEEKVQQAFTKAGYDPNGPLVRALKNSDIQQTFLKGRLKPFGEGQLNSVYKGHFKDKDGKIQERLIKFEASYKDEKSMPGFFKLAGINASCTKETARNLASKALDDILGWNSIVPTQIGLIKHPVTQEYTIATAMERAPGVSGYGEVIGEESVTKDQLQKYLEAKAELQNNPNGQDILNGLLINFGAYEAKDGKEIKDKDGNLTDIKIQKRSHSIDPHDPTLKTAFLKLQLQDIIMNQGDRHLGNYFIHTAPSQNGEKKAVLGIMGIDNDLSGGTTAQVNGYKVEKDQKTNQNSQNKNPDPKDKYTYDKNPNKVICLPPTIPSSLCYEMLNIPVGTFKDTLALYLGKEEAEAATQRLEKVKAHVFEVLQNNIKHGEESLLYPYHNSNSYWMSFLDVHFPAEVQKLHA